MDGNGMACKHRTLTRREKMVYEKLGWERVWGWDTKGWRKGPKERKKAMAPFIFEDYF